MNSDEFPRGVEVGGALSPEARHHTLVVHHHRPEAGWKEMQEVPYKYRAELTKADS